jgi:hypothetical protein
MSLLDILRAQNEWWSTGKVPLVLLKDIKRIEFKKAIDQIDDDRILGMIGPRRTGKTTILYQLINKILENIKPERILFFTADDPALLPYKDNLFENIIKTFYEDVLMESKRAKKVYIFIDEIHFLADWELWLKKYYDLKYNIKFIISSSSAIHIQRKSKESLVGRIFDILLLPLSFRDFIALSGKKDIAQYYQKLTFDSLVAEPAIRLLKFDEECIILLNKYLLYGGFPEAIFNENIYLWQEKLISDVLRKVLYRDLAELYNVRIPSKLEELFVNIAANTSETFSYSSLSRNLGISIEAVINYISYLEAAYLVGELRLYSKTQEKSLRSNRKFFLMDCGLRNAVQRSMSIQGENIGLLVESVIQKHVYVFAEARGMKTSYFREKGEVDIILHSRDILLPIEVKYQSSISKSDCKTLVSFMEGEKIDKGILVTRDLLDRQVVKGKDVRMVPAWLFLMIVS